MYAPLLWYHFAGRGNNGKKKKSLLFQTCDGLHQIVYDVHLVSNAPAQKTAFTNIYLFQLN